MSCSDGRFFVTHRYDVRMCCLCSSTGCCRRSCLSFLSVLSRRGSSVSRRVGQALSRMCSTSGCCRCWLSFLAVLSHRGSSVSRRVGQVLLMCFHMHRACATHASEYPACCHTMCRVCLRCPWRLHTQKRVKLVELVQHSSRNLHVNVRNW